MQKATITATGVIALVLAASTASASAVPDWGNVADVGTIEIKTTDPEGEAVERTIWLVVLDGQGYIRASGASRWDANIDAKPDVTVEIEDVSYDLRATRIPEGATYDAVMDAMREKYGIEDMLLTPLRFLGGSPRILRLDARPGIPMRPPS